MTPQSNDPLAALAAANETLKALAIGEATGDAAMGDFFVTVAEQIGANLRSFEDTAKMYQWRFEVMNAEKTRRGRETATMPSGNSLSSQITKAKTITQLGVYEQRRTGTIAVLRSVAVVPACAWKYKPLIVAAGAIASTLDDDANASDEALLDAAMEAIDNIPVKVKTTETALLAIAKLYDKLVADEKHGAVLRKAYDVHHVDARDTGNALTRLINAVKIVEAQAALDA